MLRRNVIILAAVFSIGIAAPCHCQEDQQQEQARQIATVTGNIAELDWAGSKMTIKGFNPADNTNREVVISVPDDAVMNKGTEGIGFAELEIGDEVTVKYYEDPQGNATLVSLEDLAP